MPEYEHWLVVQGNHPDASTHVMITPSRAEYTDLLDMQPSALRELWQVFADLQEEYDLDAWCFATTCGRGPFVIELVRGKVEDPDHKKLVYDMSNGELLP